MRTLAISLILVALAIFAAAQTMSAPRERDKDRDEAVHITEGPRVLNLTAHSATIEWKTNKNAANHIRYGLNPSHPDKSKYVAGGSKEHSLTLTGLQPGKTYYYEIMERSEEVRQRGSFTTPGSPHETNTPHKDRR